MDCESCRDRRTEVPFIVHESDMARLERTIKRLWILLILMLVVIVGGTIAWVVYEKQYEDVVITTEQEADNGSTNYAVGGDYYGGTAEGDG